MHRPGTDPATLGTDPAIVSKVVTLPSLAVGLGRSSPSHIRHIKEPQLKHRLHKLQQGNHFPFHQTSQFSTTSQCPNLQKEHLHCRFELPCTRVWVALYGGLDWAVRGFDFPCTGKSLKLIHFYEHSRPKSCACFALLTTSRQLLVEAVTRFVVVRRARAVRRTRRRTHPLLSLGDVPVQPRRNGGIDRRAERTGVQR